ncbi:MAG TPA: carboxypeptidase-like regulatory domain-containing protein [Gemmatimonadales bacterium]
MNRRTPAVLAALAIFSAPAAAQQNGAVTGALVDRLTRRPVEGARVNILGTALGTSSDTAGRFDVRGVPAGVRVIQVRAIGYVVSSWVVDLGEGQTIQQTFELEGRTVPVDSITATGRELEGWRTESGFEQRRARGGGWFIGRQEILQRHAEMLSELMRSVPGLLMTCRGRACNVIMESSSRPCAPEYFLDGFPASNSTGPSFPLQQIRGVEIYNSRFSVPSEFQRPNQQCGVIAIWTTDPGSRLGNH